MWRGIQSPLSEKRGWWSRFGRRSALREEAAKKPWSRPSPAGTEWATDFCALTCMLSNFGGVPRGSVRGRSPGFTGG